MTLQDIHEIIPQIPGESDASYQRLLTMLTHQIRTLEDLHVYLEENEPDRVVSISQLLKCSSKDNWMDRRHHYHQTIDEEIQKENEDLFQKLNNTSIREMEEFMEDLHTLRVDVMNTFKNKGISSHYALISLNHYSQSYDRAVSIYYTAARHKREPDNDNEVQQDPEEITINKDLLDDDNMKNRLQILRDVMEDKP